MTLDVQNKGAALKSDYFRIEIKKADKLKKDAEKA